MRILIAEDDQSFQLMIEKLMAKWGYEFDLASNGQEAVEQAKKNEGKYDICHMDIDMPVMNGFEATRAIRRKTKYLPIIAVSGNLSIEDKYSDIDMDDFLKKPYDFKDLHDKICAFGAKGFKALPRSSPGNDSLSLKERPTLAKKSSTRKTFII